MNTQSAKAKGRRLQQWVRDRLLGLFPALQPDDVRSCPMGSQGEDVQLSPVARALFPFTVECKARAEFVAYGWLQQAAAKARDGVMPVLIVKADRADPLVILAADDFFRLAPKFALTASSAHYYNSTDST